MQWGGALGCSGLKGGWGEELESLSVECGLIYREGFGWDGVAGGKESFSIVKRVFCSLVLLFKLEEVLSMFKSQEGKS